MFISMKCVSLSPGKSLNFFSPPPPLTPISYLVYNDVGPVGDLRGVLRGGTLGGPVTGASDT